MKICRLLLSALLASASLVAAAQRQIAFERDNAIWVANFDGTGERRIADGTWPAISPDGTRVAFVAIEKSENSYARRIAVTDIASGQTIAIKDVPSDNVSQPAWSPEGKRIAFVLRQNDGWQLATVAPDGTDLRIFKKKTPTAGALYSPSWARDEVSIFCHDMTNVYQISLDGAVLASWNIEKIIPNGGIGADGRVAVSPDSKRLLLSLDMGEENERPDWDGPPAALWTFEIATRTARRITPRTLFGSDGVWIDNENILFLSQNLGEKTASLYRMSIQNTKVKLIAKNARYPSVSAR